MYIFMLFYCSKFRKDTKIKNRKVVKIKKEEQCFYWTLTYCSAMLNKIKTLKARSGAAVTCD